MNDKKNEKIGLSYQRLTNLNLDPYLIGIAVKS